MESMVKVLRCKQVFCCSQFGLCGIAFTVRSDPTLGNGQKRGAKNDCVLYDGNVGHMTGGNMERISLME